MTERREAETPGSLPDFLWTADEPLVVRAPAERTGAVSAGTIPGEVGIWVFVLGDMTIFGLMFLTFMWGGRQDPELFAAGTVSLLQPLGFANTLVLLLSSWLVVLAVHAHRRDLHAVAARELAAALVCAILFCAVKAFEYRYEIQSGHRPSSDLYFTYYFVLTGMHLLHVLVGSALLVGWFAKASAGRPWASARRYAECSAVYWHMVDLLWVVIFTLLYVVHLP